MCGRDECRYCTGPFFTCYQSVALGQNVHCEETDIPLEVHEPDFSNGARPLKLSLERAKPGMGIVAKDP